MLHTGDWKIDPTPIIGVPTDERRLRELGDEGVLALIGDSTNAVREGRSPSETEVAATITELVKAARGRVAVTTFASNVARIRSAALAARAAEREVVVVGRAMERIVQVARETGWNREQLLTRLCVEKMGLTPHAWREPGAKLMTFSTVILGPEPFER